MPAYEADVLAPYIRNRSLSKVEANAITVSGIGAAFFTCLSELAREQRESTGTFVYDGRTVATAAEGVQEKWSKSARDLSDRAIVVSRLVEDWNNLTRPESDDAGEFVFRRVVHALVSRKNRGHQPVSDVMYDVRDLNGTQRTIFTFRELFEYLPDRAKAIFVVRHMKQGAEAVAAG